MLRIPSFVGQLGRTLVGLPILLDWPGHLTVMPIMVVNMGDLDQRGPFALPHLDNMSIRPQENIS